MYAICATSKLRILYYNAILYLYHQKGTHQSTSITREAQHWVCPHNICLFSSFCLLPHRIGSPCIITVQNCEETIFFILVENIYKITMIVAHYTGRYAWQLATAACWLYFGSSDFQVYVALSLSRSIHIWYSVLAARRRLSRTKSYADGPTVKRAAILHPAYIITGAKI